ncbi:MAG TPA: rRNA maturation RNase YbeY [Burkholderiales bacterium]|jgi:probable rRNA maturation factor|nr:rRNA maturation RNase YbeY [Burkholderiales bacterium]
MPSAGALRAWALGAGQAAGPIVLRIVGAREGRELNRRYRRVDRPTNVLSFPYGRGGDIVLCHPVIRREARVQGKSIAAHYAHLVVHGVLHLRGYDHHEKQQALRMERAEIRALRRFGLRNPYELK